MVQKVRIKNYKSIEELVFDPGRINVLIGANGSGKTNILESIALAGAAAGRKLDNEFLASRGIRIPDDPRLMRSGFELERVTEPLEIDISGLEPNGESVKFGCHLQTDNLEPFPRWRDVTAREFTSEEMTRLLNEVRSIRNSADLINELAKRQGSRLNLEQFLVYSPENTYLRRYDEESQVRPLGIRGEGLLRFFKIFCDSAPSGSELMGHLFDLFDWVGGMHLQYEQPFKGVGVEFVDRFMPEGLQMLDQMSTNEGFLFVLFYLLLFSSTDTPAFFAIDNVDAALNPKLCAELMIRIVHIANKMNKQAILTTHNPALLDGLNLHDQQQKLFVVSRDIDGKTRIHRVPPPKEKGTRSIKLSEAFVKGYLGALPQNF